MAVLQPGVPYYYRYRLTDLSGSQAFNLEPPKVSRLPLDWSPLADPSGEPEQGYRLCVDDLPWRIRVRPSNG